MAKKKDYSPEAIQARQQFELDEYNRVKAEKKKEVKPEATEATGFQTPPMSNLVPTPNYGSGGFTPSPATGGQDWNYKDAKTGLDGKPLETRKFAGLLNITPKGFDPMGNPYFGRGLDGWAKKWAYKLSEDLATQEQSDDAWKEFWTTSSQLSNMLLNEKVEGDRKSQEVIEKGEARGKEAGRLFLQGAGQLFEAIGNEAETSKTAPITTPILRATNALVGMTLEAFAYVSEIPERVAGVNRAMRDYANNAGTAGPTLEFTDAENRADESVGLRQEAADAAVHTFVPIIAAYDTARFWLASPGSAKEKFDALDMGWREGSILYTELYQPATRALYLERIKAGEDPELLAMELANPWAELVGEVIFDPLNFIGSIGKAKKAADTVGEAARVVERTGLAAIPEFADDMKAVAKATNEAEAAAAFARMEERVTQAAIDTGRAQESAKAWKMTDLTAGGNRLRETRAMSSYLNNIVQGIRNAGGGADEVLEYVAALAKRASGEKNAVRESIAYFAHSPFQALGYNQQALDTGYMLSRIMNDGDIIKDLRTANKAGWDEVRRVIDSKIQKSVEYAFPEVSEMAKASDRIKELSKLGEVPDEKTLRLADHYKELVKTNPGVVKWSKTLSAMEATLKPLSSMLSNTYFSLSYGYAFRNYMQNMVTLWVDGGLLFTKEALPEFTKAGIKSTRLDNAIIQATGSIPEAMKGKTLLKSITEDSLGKKFFDSFNNLGYSPAALADAAETYAGKMIYLKKYRESMEAIMKPGALLPDMATWNKAGFSEGQLENFADILRANNYNHSDAMEVFSKTFKNGSIDNWRTLDWVKDDVKKGLMEYEDSWNEIVRLTQTEGKSQREIMDLLDEMKIAVRKNANKAAKEPVRISTSDPFWREVSDAAEQSGKFVDRAADNKHLNLKLAFDRAAAEFSDALNVAAHKDPSNPAVNEIMSFVSNVNRQKLNEVASASVDAKRLWAWDITKQAKSNFTDALWDEALLGAKPDVLTRDVLLQATWNHYRESRSSVWGNYFETYINKASELAKGTKQQEQFAKAKKALLELEAYRQYIYNNDGIYTRVPSLIPASVGETGNANNIRAIANSYGLASSNGKDKALLNIINKYSDVPYARLEDIPPNVAEQIIAKRQGHAYVGFIKAEGDGFIPNVIEKGVPVPAVRDPNVPPIGHAYTETKDGLLDALDHVQNGIKERWGLKSVVGGNANELKGMTGAMDEKFAIARAKSQMVAEKYRDFALLPYGEKTNLDLAMGMVYPYQFWYSRSYANWMKRTFATNPEVISRYANLKEAMASEQRDLPDWWKSQVNVHKMFGIETENPMYMNLEATLFPLYGLTGVDYNDPKKRTGWFTNMLDDMGKFGPSMFAPIQWATAAVLYIQGEKEAASRWGGRAIQQTAAIKAASSYFGTPIELDPMVQMFSGEGPLDFRAADPNEEGRIARALSAMEAEGVYSREQLMEAMRTQEGDIWNEAYQRATQARAPGQLSSFFFGVGFKGRPQSDIEIDKFYGDYSRLKNLFYSEYITKEQYQNNMNTLRKTYPFMDMLLLSRRAGDGRDAAFAYNVVSRIPPGSSKEFYDVAGLDERTVQKFYDSGGRLDSMPESERMRFMAAIIDLSAMAAMPKDATRQEWTLAKQTYSEMTNLLKEQYGNDIQDKINKFYDLTPDERDSFLKAYPEVESAMSQQTAYIANTPILSAYYGGLDVTSRYYSNLVYDQLDEEFGIDIQDKYEKYWLLKDNLQDAEAKAFYNANDLKAYENRKKELLSGIDTQIMDAAKNIPEGQGIGIRPEFKPQTGIQEDLLEYASVDQQSQLAQTIFQGLSPAAQELLQEHFATGEDLPPAVKRQLAKVAEKNGLTEYEALRLLGVEQ